MGKSLKGRELGAGITQRKDGLYQARFTDRFGKRRTLYSAKLSEITKKLREQQYLDEKQGNAQLTKITLNEWYDIWRSTYKTNCRNSTLYHYDCMYNSHLRETIGSKQLTSLNTATIHITITGIQQQSSRDRCKMILGDILKKAVEAELIVKNPVKNVDLAHRDTRTPHRVVSLEEIEQVCSVIPKKHSWLKYYILLGWHTGLRMGELSALTWNDVDLANQTLSVTKTLLYTGINGKMQFDIHPPKTRAGIRTIPFGSAVLGVLQSIERYGNTDLIFTNGKGMPLHPNYISKSLSSAVAKANVKPFTSHCLRHSFATRCIESGMRPKTLQYILGHEKLSITMDLYCHVTVDALRDEMALVDGVVVV